MKQENKFWDIYPRPQLKRESYYSLNGEWTLNQKPVLIPYPPQSPLSQYHDTVDDHLHYEKNFHIPSHFFQDNKRIILHFGAVDQITDVYINDSFVGQHIGGYLPFSFDVTSYVHQEENRLVVEVIDELSHDYPYGKQTKEPGGMWYTPVSGIWQSVWMECVPENEIKNIKITTSLTHLYLEVDTDAPTYTITIPYENETFKQTYTEKKISIDLSDVFSEVHLWSVDDPYLYPLYIHTNTDSIESYFAMRKISIQKQNGLQRICLNDQPIFLHGVLDQGYYHDGLFTPNKPEEYKNDILRMKELGLNMLRKHIKIEPDIFYYYCDQLGMLVMQDMVNNGSYSYLFDTVLPNAGILYRPDKVSRKKKKHEFFIQHMKDTLYHLHNHPCIIAYTIFNEGWGQFNSDDMYDLCKGIDSTRLYDSTSGWFWQKKSDVESYHVYFKNKVLRVKKDKPVLLSECGGYTRAIPRHVYKEDTTYGYGSADDENALTRKIIQLYDEMVFPSIPQGLCGSIYTQVTDIEEEINGFYTYDREICKVNKKEMQLLAKRLKDSFQ